MSVVNNCIAVCGELRKMGFGEKGMTSVIPELSLLNAIRKQRWSMETQARYLSKYLLEYGYLEKVENGYQLTGEDLVGSHE